MRSLYLGLLFLAGCTVIGPGSAPSWFSLSPAEGPAGLDPAVRAALGKAGPAPDFRTRSVEDLRRTFQTGAAAVPKLRESLFRVEDRVLPAGVPVRLYVPE